MNRKSAADVLVGFAHDSTGRGLAYAAIAIDSGNFAWGWVALCGPAMMYWLLVYASGIPPLEAHMLRSRGAAFRAYQARVNAFWPGPPRGLRRTESS